MSRRSLSSFFLRPSSLLGELWRRVYYLLHRSRMERELDEEMAAHRAMKGPGEPRFGNALKLREESRDVWGWGWWDRLVQDVTFGARMLRRSPAFTLTALIVLTLGVGINIVAFQVLNAVAWHPLPVRDPDSLVRFDRRAKGSISTTFSYPAFRFYAQHNTVLAASMAVHFGAVALEDDASRDVNVEFVSPGYLSELGTVPAFGRLLDGSSDAEPEAEPVIVLSHWLWQGRFGADPTIVGRTIRVNSRPVMVVGVAAASFVGITSRKTHAWMPIEKHPHAFPGSNLLTDERAGSVLFFARLKPGLAASAAEDGLKPAVVVFHQRQPDVAWEEWLQTRPAGLYAPLGGKSVPPVLIVAGFTTIVLLASCTNLALLILARGSAREREISIRLSVGATRRRIVRQLMTESALLSLIGTALGLMLSFTVARVVLSFGNAPGLVQPSLDIRVALFSFAIAGLAAGLFGIVPALQAVRPTAARTRTRGILVAAQVATGCTLLVVGGLLVRGVQHVLTMPLGFEYAEHVTISPGLHANGFKPAAARAYWLQLRATLERLPGVEALSLTRWTPLGNSRMASRNPNGTTAFFHNVEPSYFEVMRIPLLGGRNLLAGEKGSAVVSDSLARAIWPGDDPLGKVFEERTVVGVVGNARTLAVGDPDATELYMALGDEQLAGAVLIVRVKGDPSGHLGAIVAAARSVDPRVTPSVGLLRDAFEERVKTSRQMAVVVSTLGVLALSVAAIGLAGLLSFSVSQRVREIGIRMALGARSLHVVCDVLRQFVWPVACGLAGGLFAAAVLSSVLRRELFGLSHLDPVSYAAAALLFSVVAFLAAAGPLRRAVRVDPATALRCE